MLKGEALAMAGDVSGAELAFRSVLEGSGADDEAVRQSIQLSIVTSRQRTGSLEAASWLRSDAKELEDDIWVENIPYDQTRSYVKGVLRSLHVYKSFYR